MRRIVTAITAAALALSLVAQSTPAEALVAGYDSSYAGESAFLTLRPAESGSFTVFFANTGSTTWTKGTSTQVDLYACLNNKTTCDVAPEESAWNPGSWLSSTRYATQVQTTVAPGAIATYTYNITVPTSAAAGDYDFNGDTGVSSMSGAAGQVHPEGYFQRVTVPTTAAASIVVTPTDTLVLQTSDATNVNRGSRSYTATITGVTACVDIALITGSRESGGKFRDTGGTTPATEDNRADNLAGTSATIEVVNGVSTGFNSTSNPGEDFVNCVTIPSDGKVTFTVDSSTPGQTPKPVVFVDANSDDQLNLTGTADASGFKAASELVGVGGQTTYIAGAATSTADAETGCVVRVDKTGKSFSLDVAFKGTVPSEAATTVTSNCSGPSSSAADATYFYDANDDFFIGGVPSTMAEFEAALSRGDIVDPDAYASSPDPSSTFNIQGDTPVVTGCTADQVASSGGGVDDIRITVTASTPSLDPTVFGAITFRFARAPITGSPATDEGTDGTVGTYSTTATGPADEDSADATFTYTDKDVPAGLWRYRVFGIVDGDEGSASGQRCETTNETSSTPGAAGAAPTSTDIRVTTSGGLNNQLDTGDVFKIVFSESMNPDSTGDVIQVQDADGTVMTIRCNGSAALPPAGEFNATCSFNPGSQTVGGTTFSGTGTEANRVAEITILNQNPPTLASQTGSTAGMQLPTNVIDQGGFKDTTGDNWNIAGSPDKVVDIE